MFGPVKAKVLGLRHLWVQYIVGAPKPEAIKLYDPFRNSECLHCHLGARRFEEGSAHKIPDLLSSIKSGKLSCVSTGCHEFVHDVLMVGCPLVLAGIVVYLLSLVPLKARDTG